MSDFVSVTSVGGLLPSDLLTRVASGDKSLPGTTAETYGLVPGERLNDHITRSWNRLTNLWTNFNDQLGQLPASEQTATAITRERWLRPLFDELGYGGLAQARAVEIDGKEYAISHQWGESVPVHLLGAKIPVDRRSPGIPGAAKSSPHGLVQEFLNRSTIHLWGLVTNGRSIRILRDNASLTRQAFLEFDLQAIFDGELYSDFVLLWLTCHRTRLEADQPEKCLLEQWSQHASTTGTRALDRLRDGVQAAIESLGEGFLAHPANTRLRQRLTDGSLTTTEYQHQLLLVIYRLLFLLVAESRDLLLAADADETARARYRDHYSLGRIVRLAQVRRGTSHDDLWDGLQVPISALWRDGQLALGLTALGSFLWSPESVEALADARLGNAHLLAAVRTLTRTRDAEAKVDRQVDYRNLGAEELGSIYESLLELHAQIDVPARKFALGTAAGNERKTTGSYYTPTSLITELLDSALDPVLDEAARSEDPEAVILDLSVIDPACGSGHFLIAAANRIAQRLATVRAGGIEATPDEVRSALREVVGRCIHGIDINPMAVELCKVSLWLEATEPGKPLSFLDHRIVCGNALLGTTPRLLAEGIPDGAYKALTGDDSKVVSALKKRNKAERKGQGVLGLFDNSVASIARPLASAIRAIDALPDDTSEQLERKATLLAELDASAAASKARLAADAWCAAFVAPKGEGEPPITTSTIRQLLDNPERVADDVVERVRSLAADYRFLHLHLAFPDVITVPDDPDTADNERTGWNGGFSVVLGNPPWERVKLQEKEFFAERDQAIADAPNAAARKRLIAATETDNPALFAAFQAAVREAEGASHFLRTSERFPLCGRGDVNTYTVFAETMRDAMAATGRVGVIVPSGIATDDTTKFFFQDLVERHNLASLFDFENRKPIFPGVHRSYKFCLLTLAGDQRPVDEAEFVFFALETADLNDPERRFTLTAEDFALLNPNTRTCPIFRTRRDAEITKGIYRRVPVLIEEGPPEKNPWGVKFSTMFHMSGDSGLFKEREDLEAEGWILSGSRFVRNDEIYLPLFEAKMVHQFDHRWATYDGPDIRKVTSVEKLDPSFVSMPRYWVPSSEVNLRAGESNLLLVWRNIARSTDERTMIASLLPRVGVGHSLQVAEVAGNRVPILNGLLNSLLMDYVSRQKLGGVNFTFGFVKQLPGPFLNIPRWIRRAIEELAYTSWDLYPVFGHSPPYLWVERRRHLLRVALDCYFMHGMAESRDLSYLLASFEVLRRNEIHKHGSFRMGDDIVMMMEKFNFDSFENVDDIPEIGSSADRADFGQAPPWVEIESSCSQST